MSSEPLLSVADLRVDVDGVPACDGLTFRTSGERVLVLGAPAALFDATTGLAPVARGTLAVRGVLASEAARTGRVAGAASDPPVPARWTVREYVEWSARLAGKDDVRAGAADALARLQLGPLATTKLAQLVPHARRATIVAAALATGAEAIALADPLAGLADEVAVTYAKVLVAALADRPWVVFAARLPLGSPLAHAADEAIVATASSVDAQGAPAAIAAAARTFVLRLHGSIDAIAPALAARGARVAEHGARAILELGPDLTTRELFSICAGAGVAVVELVPVARALA